MPAAAVISSGVHERSIAVVKTFLVDMIRKAVVFRLFLCGAGFACAARGLVEPLFYNRCGL